MVTGETRKTLKQYTITLSYCGCPYCQAAKAAVQDAKDEHERKRNRHKKLAELTRLSQDLPGGYK